MGDIGLGSLSVVFTYSPLFVLCWIILFLFCLFVYLFIYFFGLDKVDATDAVKQHKYLKIKTLEKSKISGSF